MTKKEHFIIILILGALFTISPFSIDMYLPAFPAIAKELHTSVSTIQLSLTSYFIGISVGQLLYGPLLDRFGRRKPLFIGLLAYIIASLACALIHSTHILILMRFLQALGGCVGLVAARALVRDLFPVSETAKIFSLLMLVLAVSPLLAPTTGAYVTVALGWHYIFIILAILCFMILVLAYYFLPEGKLPDETISLKPKPILLNFGRVITQPQFFTYCLSGSVASAIVYAYIAGSPDTFLVIYKVEERNYGWIFAFIAVAIIGSSQLNTLFLKKYTSEQLVLAGLYWQLCIGSLLIIGSLYGLFTLIPLIIIIFLFMCGQGLTIPNASALALAPFTRLTGSASALLGSLQLAMGAGASLIVSLIPAHSELPMVAVMVSCSLISLLLYKYGNKRAASMDTSGNSAISEMM